MNDALTYVWFLILWGVIAFFSLFIMIYNENIYYNDIIYAQKKCEINDGLLFIDHNVFEKNEIVCNNGAIFHYKAVRIERKNGTLIKNPRTN